MTTCRFSERIRMNAAQERDFNGKFLNLPEGFSAGVPRAKLFLPSLPYPWKARWYRKGHLFYIDARRVSVAGRKPVRICRTIDKILEAVTAKEAEIQEHGQLAHALTTGQRWEAAECFVNLAPLGVSLREAVAYFIARHPQGGLSRPIEAVVEELVRKKEVGNLRNNYVSGLKYRLKKFASKFPGKRIGAITTEDIEGWLKTHPKWSPNTIKGHVSTLKVLFYYAVKRGYAVENPCLRLELPKRRIRRR